MKLEVGKKYELNNGEVHECTTMHGDDPFSVDEYGYGPFSINGMLYHLDGNFANCGDGNSLSVKRCVSPALTPGNTYTARNGQQWECIFVRDGKAWMIMHDSSAAYTWDAETGAALCLGGGEYNIAFPETRHGTVEYVNGEPQFDTWQEDK